MATQPEEVGGTPEGEAVRREALAQAEAVRAQYEESKRLDPDGEKGLYVRRGSSESIPRELRGG